MASLRIQRAREQHVPIILQMIQALAEYEKLPLSATANESRLRDTLFGPAPMAETILAFLGDEPAGLAVYFQTYSTFRAQANLYLEDLFVPQQFRGAGVGKALLAYVARVAIERGCGRVDWSVLNWNEPAIGFYRSIGAQAIDDWTVYRLSGEALAELARQAP